MMYYVFHNKKIELIIDKKVWLNNNSKNKQEL